MVRAYLPRWRRHACAVVLSHDTLLLCLAVSRGEQRGGVREGEGKEQKNKTKKHLESIEI